MKSYKFLPLHRLTAFVLLIAFSLTSLADPQLGRATLGTFAAPSLKTTTSLSRAVTSFRFLSRVGGVGFDGVSKPAEGTKVKELNLNYDPAMPDGGRVRLTIDGKPVSVSLFDWELIPIVKYATSDSTSCFTLFGELEDKDEEKRLNTKGAKIMNYDAAFKDTLLGLRLFQLDVMLIDDEFATKLPTEDGRWILGAGESEPNVPAALEHKARYDEARRDLRLRGYTESEGFPTNLESWLVCDQTVNLRFAIKDGSLELTGELFFHFWSEDQAVLQKLIDRETLKQARRAGIAGPKETLEKLRSKQRADETRLSATLEKLVLEEAKKGGLVPAQATVEDLDTREEEERAKLDEAFKVAYLAEAKKQNLAKPTEDFKEFRLRMGEQLRTADETEIQRLEELLKVVKAKAEEEPGPVGVRARAFLDSVATSREKAFERTKAEAGRLSAISRQLDDAEDESRRTIVSASPTDDRKPVYLRRFSEEHRALIPHLAETNPAVWNAARKTMRYSAFFRYCKKTFPAAWKSFAVAVATLDLASAQPKGITTPTVLQMQGR